MGGEVVGEALGERRERYVDLGDLGMGLEDLTAALVEQRERPDRREVLVDVVFGQGLVHATVELVVL